MGRRPGCNQPRRTPRTITLNIANSSETSKKYMPANAAAAMVLCRGPRRALLATLWRAITTRAITAGFRPVDLQAVPPLLPALPLIPHEAHRPHHRGRPE